MRSMFVLVAALVVGAASAHAQFGPGPGPGPGHGGPGHGGPGHGGPGHGGPGHGGPGHGGPGGYPNPGAPDLCQATYNGTWNFRGGRPMTVSVTPGFRNTVNVLVSHQNGSNQYQGSCNYNYDGSATLVFGSGNMSGNLTLSPNGQASGIIYSFQYWGSMQNGGGGVPGYPGPDYSRCYGVVNGTWMYKGGRPMTLTIQQAWRDQVTVIVTTRNGSEQTQGVCRPQYDGSAQVEFRGTTNFGNVTIDTANRVMGMVGNLGFQGFKQ